MKEPIIHSHITYVLSDGHPLADETVNCIRCAEMVHAFNNECMQTWVETGEGNFCFACFVKEVDPARGVLEYRYGLHTPEPGSEERG